MHCYGLNERRYLAGFSSDYLTATWERFANRKLIIRIMEVTK